ncbi:DUF4974 domain-containing protein [Mucilaginibacter sp. JRF]|uniref:FecR family protein n=1 Tax=Mucilaginibacter sp. JRF TaxID=2780088 RepID=UPI001880D8BE|nr:FecR family protein [Mucilaginibacter sp. JRF]MBE9586008.1 DUF4974 domain-containing protein [Mucilaginibacter sp. JRF]
MEQNQHLLYQKFLDNACSDEELSRLFDLFGTADEAVLRKLIEDELLSENESPASEYETERLEAVRQLVKSEIHSRRHKLRSLVIKFSAAAAIVVMIASAVMLWPRDSHQPVKATKVAAVIKPGALQATLKLANGQQIVLGQQVDGTLARFGRTVVVAHANDGVSYQNTRTGVPIKNSSNTLTTARGQQSPYPLILEDGTKVWLNAASSVTFPTQFTGNERVVHVTGEAYFEVAHQRSRPFKVVTDRQEINVLGTHFNVKAYDDEYTICTTLLQGSVRVKDVVSGKTRLLVPGQQSRFSKANGQVAVAVVDIDAAIAWKRGFFIFNDQKITSIMNSMSRWYDVDVEYKNYKNNNETFGGTFSRSSKLADILSSMQSLGAARFKIEDKKIIVSN